MYKFILFHFINNMINVFSHCFNVFIAVKSIKSLIFFIFNKFFFKIIKKTAIFNN